jgi:SAM-dependent methyltransferase
MPGVQCRQPASGALNRDIEPPIELGLPYWFHLFFPDRLLTTELNILVIGCEHDLALRLARANPRARVTAVDERPAALENAARAREQRNLANLDLVGAWPSKPAPKPAPKPGSKPGSKPGPKPGPNPEPEEGFDLAYYNPQGWPGEPSRVLERAAGLLRPGGSLHLTVRAKYAWTGVRTVRELLDRLGIEPNADGYSRARQLVAALAPDHPWNLLGPDPKLRPDDLLADWLGPEEPSFSVPEVYALLAGSGMALQRFTYQAYYLPQCSPLARTPLLGEVRQLPPAQQQALMELYWPGVRYHLAVACRADRPAHTFTPDFSGQGWLRYAPLLPARLPIEDDESPVGAKARLRWRAPGMPEVSVALGGFQYRLLRALDRAEELGDVVGIAGLSGDPQLRDEWAREFFQLMADYDFLHFRTCRVPRGDASGFGSASSGFGSAARGFESPAFEPAPPALDPPPAAVPPADEASAARPLHSVEPNSVTPLGATPAAAPTLSAQAPSVDPAWPDDDASLADPMAAIETAPPAQQPQPGPSQSGPSQSGEAAPQPPSLPPDPPAPEQLAAEALAPEQLAPEHLAAEQLAAAQLAAAQLAPAQLAAEQLAAEQLVAESPLDIVLPPESASLPQPAPDSQLPALEPSWDLAELTEELAQQRQQPQDEQDPTAEFERILFEACPLCDEPGYRPFRHAEAEFLAGAKFVRVPIPWMRCRRCAHVFAEGYFTGEVWQRILEVSLGERGSLRQAVANRAQASRIVSTVTTLREKAAGRWLDVDCSYGGLISVAAEFGYDTVGLDCCGQGAERLRELGYQVRDGSLFDCADGPFDVISLSGTLDRTPFPAQALSHVHRLLTPRGLLFLSAPSSDSLSWRNLDFEGLNPYWARLERYHAFQRKSVFRLLENTGFEPCGYAAGVPEPVGMEIIACRR